MFTAKVRCTRSTPNQYVEGTTDLVFNASYEDGKNAEWAAKTPTLSLQMQVVDSVAQQVAVGDEITLTFAKDE